MPEIITPSGEDKTPLEADAPNSIKGEERVNSKKVRWVKKATPEPEEFVEDAELGP